MIVATAVVAAVFLLRHQPVEEELRPQIDTMATATMRGDPGGAGSVVDEPAPDFRLATLEGDTLAMADLKGQVVVINFWATWCAPCRVEIPDLIEMQEILEDDGVRFVGIVLDADNLDAVQAFADDAKFNYPIALDDGAVTYDFGGVYALPTTILIDRAGVVVRKIPGLVTKNSLMPLLKELAAT